MVKNKVKYKHEPIKKYFIKKKNVLKIKRKKGKDTDLNLTSDNIRESESEYEEDNIEN